MQTRAGWVIGAALLGLLAVTANAACSSSSAPPQQSNTTTSPPLAPQRSAATQVVTDLPGALAYQTDLHIGVAGAATLAMSAHEGAILTWRSTDLRHWTPMPLRFGADTIALGATFAYPAGDTVDLVVLTCPRGALSEEDACLRGAAVRAFVGVGRGGALSWRPSGSVNVPWISHEEAGLRAASGRAATVPVILPVTDTSAARVVWLGRGGLRAGPTLPLNPGIVCRSRGGGWELGGSGRDTHVAGARPAPGYVGYEADDELGHVRVLRRSVHFFGGACNAAGLELLDGIQATNASSGRSDGLLQRGSDPIVALGSGVPDPTPSGTTIQSMASATGFVAVEGGATTTTSLPTATPILMYWVQGHRVHLSQPSFAPQVAVMAFAARNDRTVVGLVTQGVRISASGIPSTLPPGKVFAVVAHT